MNQNLPQLGFSQWKIPSGFWVVPKIIITTYMLNQKRKLPKNWGLSRKRERECSETTFDLEVTWSIITLIFPMCITVILLWQTIKLLAIFHLSSSFKSVWLTLWKFFLLIVYETSQILNGKVILFSLNCIINRFLTLIFLLDCKNSIYFI